jgi:hypothetical protein
MWGQLLPSKTGASIVTRYKNQVGVQGFVDSWCWVLGYKVWGVGPAAAAKDATASIVTRYKNQVRRKDPRAVLLLSDALLGKERPAAWGNADNVARCRTNPELAAAAGA